MDITLKKGQIGGTIKVPSSKSQTIRALLVATFAQGNSIIHNPLYSSDTLSCIAGCRALGAVIIESEETLIVQSPIEFPTKVTIDCGNSGTTLYLLSAMVASFPIEATFTGDAQLKNRPVRPLLEALISLGVELSYPSNYTKQWYPPFTLKGPVKGGSVNITCHTSQHLSGLLLGSILGEGTTEIHVDLLNEKPYVEMTLQWIEKQQLSMEYNKELTHFVIPGKQSYKPINVTIGGDYSSASFFFCAAAVAKGSIRVTGLLKEDKQGDKEILSILEQMGCEVVWQEEAVTVSPPQSKELVGGEFDLNAIPDALPILAVTACFVKGTTILGNVPQARIKETDRIESMKVNLEKLGVKVEDTEDSLIIHGSGSLDGGIVDGFEDHRIIMAMAIASLNTETPLTIKGIEAVDVTFPSFFTLLETIKQEKQ